VIIKTLGVDDMNGKILAEVKKIGANGVSVELEDGQRAWLPEYEIVLDSEVDIDLEKECPVGSKFPVIIYDKEIGGYGRLIVSKARAEFDPWIETANWNEGEIKQMKVKVVTSSKAYGPIKPGIEAEVSCTEIQKQLSGRYVDHCNILAEDFLMGQITKIDQEARLVHLNIVSYESDIEARKTHSSGESRIRWDDDVETEYEPNDIFSVGINSMLVVDDDPLFLHPVCDYFREHVDEILKAETYEKAKQLLSAESQMGLDLALIDVNLARLGSQLSDLAGFEIAKGVAEKYPGCPIVLVTGEENITEQKLKVAGNLEIVEFLRKPVGVIKLREMLSSAVGKEPKTLREFIASPVSREDAVEETTYQEREEHDSLWHIKKLLQELKGETGAALSILFSLHPVTYQVEIVASSSDLTIAKRVFKKLRFSPVRDVAVDEEIILEREASSHRAEGKHLWLRRAISYESCIGVPVRGGGGLVYSMFLLHPQANRLSRDELSRAQDAAARIGDFLQRRNYLEVASKDKRFSVAGMTYSSLGHELRVILSGADTDTINIKETVGNLNFLDSTQCDRLRRCIDRLSRQYERAIEICETFWKISRPEETKRIRVWGCVIEAAKLAQKEMKIYKTILIPQESTDKLGIAETEAEETGLQQVFLNLFLNAPQQMELYLCPLREVTI